MPQYGDRAERFVTAAFDSSRRLGIACGVVLLAACGPPPPAATSSPGALRPSAGGRSSTVGSASVDVLLEMLSFRRAQAIGEERNPFRFSPSSDRERTLLPAPPAIPVSRSRSTGPTGDAGGSVARSRFGPVDSIRFIGLVEARRTPGSVAVPTDDAGVYHGMVDDIVNGRYLILAIEGTAVEVEDLSSGPRLTLRLSGS